MAVPGRPVCVLLAAAGLAAAGLTACFPTSDGAMLEMLRAQLAT